MLFLGKSFELQNYITVTAVIITRDRIISMICDIQVGYLHTK